MPSVSCLPHPPSKKRRLQFTSELPVQIPRYNPDGSETVEWARYQSNLRLKSKWDSICDKFAHAHLAPQDEIYLGDESKGEAMKVVKDRGILRQVAQPIEFGVFHIREQDLEHVKLLPGRPTAMQARRVAAAANNGNGNDHDHDRDRDNDDDNDDELGEWTHTVQFSPMVRNPLAAAGRIAPPLGSAPGSDPLLSQDAHLAEFLEAEARRRAACDDQALSTDDEDDIIDLRDVPHRTHPPALPTDRRTTAPRASSLSSSDEIDILSVDSTSDDDRFEAHQAAKQQAIQHLLDVATPFETLPFPEIEGLAHLLGVGLSPPASGRIETDAHETDPAPRPSGRCSPSARTQSPAPHPPHPGERTPSRRPTVQPCSPTRPRLPPRAASSAADPNGSDSDSDADAGPAPCAGRGRCAKSFCMQCGSVAAVRRRVRVRPGRGQGAVRDEPATPCRGAERSTTVAVGGKRGDNRALL